MSSWNDIQRESNELYEKAKQKEYEAADAEKEVEIFRRDYARSLGVDHRHIFIHNGEVVYDPR